MAANASYHSPPVILDVVLQLAPKRHQSFLLVVLFRGCLHPSVSLRHQSRIQILGGSLQGLQVDGRMPAMVTSCSADCL